MKYGRESFASIFIHPQYFMRTPVKAVRKGKDGLNHCADLCLPSQGWGLPRFPGHTQVADVHVCAEKHEPFIDEGVAIMLHVEKQVAG